MSTRCQVQVIGQGYPQDDKDRFTLYHHSDGYPSHLLTDIVKAYAIGSAPPSFTEGMPKQQQKEYTQANCWVLGRTGKVASFLCAAHPGQMEPLPYHELHGDIEWFYRVHLDGGYSMAAKPTWQVEVFRVCGPGFESERLHRIGKWPLARVTGKVEQIETRAKLITERYYPTL